MVIDVDKAVASDREFVNRSATLLARAFHDYPEYVYLFPDDTTRHAKLVALLGVMTRYCLRHGKVMASSERLESILMYLPPPARINGGDMMRSGAFWMLFKLGVHFLPRQNRIINVIVKARTTTVPSPHAYLFLLATDPAFQKQGHATTLMWRFLEQLDASGTACYLETSEKRNLAFYQYFGFDLIETQDVKGANITVHALVRKGRKERGTGKLT
ncbi:MAG: GNAT family N-acetyltransferase [Candidatus Lokiarchaeota archaeon]|nr:GNAT family N-acetyltransferase [Candidatus Lokiarchaeota archaeon]